MKFLADESCDYGVVSALRAAGHDVAAISEKAPGIPDQHVAELALQEERLLLTEDKDFGQLVFAAAKQAVGVVLIRFPGNARRELQASIVELVDEHGRRLQGKFAVLLPGRVRIGELP